MNGYGKQGRYVFDPSTRPLEVLRKESHGRSLCDKQGCRLPGVHWVMSIALPANAASTTKAPSLRTIGIERISDAGIDFVMKRTSPTARSIEAGLPVSILYSQGKYLPGESTEQWRGEGHCELLPLPEILDLVPSFTMVSMVGSQRAVNTAQNDVLRQTETSGERMAVPNKSHLTEIMQTTRMELENGDINMEELESCIRAFRFQPTRMECMLGGPDSIMWDRWEWLRAVPDEASDGSIPWRSPNHLVPH